MSLILDALRKMEQERKTKRKSSPQVRTEVLNYSNSAATPAKAKILPVTFGILLGLAAATVLILFTITTKGKKSLEPLPRVKPAAVAETPVTAPSTAPTPQPLTPVPQPPKIRTAPAAPKKQLAAAVTQKNGDNGIALSGIAWQEEHSLRRAVINGYLVEEGAEVLGAKIIEIKEDRVRFSKSGELFEIVHNAGSLKRPTP